MKTRDVLQRLLATEPLPPERRSALTSDTFWSLMDRWKVPTERALRLIDCEGAGIPSGSPRQHQFPLSEDQAKILSCLLEIDLTLAVAEVGEERLHQRRRSASRRKASPLDDMGRCDPRQAAAVLWSLTMQRRGGVGRRALREVNAGSRESG
jgi:hypothetical protein